MSTRSGGRDGGGGVASAVARELPAVTRPGSKVTHAFDARPPPRTPGHAAASRCVATAQHALRRRGATKGRVLAALGALMLVGMGAVVFFLPPDGAETGESDGFRAEARSLSEEVVGGKTFDCIDVDSFYVPRLYACLVRHYPTWDGPDSTRARAQAAAAAGKLPESWEVASDVHGSDAQGDKRNRLRTLPGAEAGRMGFMAFNVSEPTMDRYGLIDEDAAAFWRAYRSHFSEGQLQVALVDKFNTTIRRRFELVRNEHARLAGTASAEAEMAAKMYGYHRATIERMSDPQVSLEGAGSRVTLRATGGGPNGYQGFTGGVHGEDADRMITALSYIAERYGEPSHLGMSVWRLKPGAQMLSRDRNRDYNLLYEGLWRPNSFFAFAGCLDSWHCGTWDANRCDVETRPPLVPIINRAKWALSKRNMLQTLLNTELLPKDKCMAESGQAPTGKSAASSSAARR
eukprot:PRCOL_00007062-RA